MSKSLKSKRIKLCLKESGGIVRLSWPITQGIPFPDKELKRDSPVRLLDSKGNILPVQTKCLATWDKDLEYVKWLLLDFQVDLKANESTNLYLEYGPDIKPVRAAQPVTLERKGKEIFISTGTLRVGLRNGCPDFLSSCEVKTKEGWQVIFGGQPAPFLYMVDQNGSWYDSCTTAPPCSITMEDIGPLRVSLCIRGYHASQNGLRFCSFMLRLHAYAGKSDLRFYHAFIFDQDPKKIELSAIGIKFPCNLGDKVRMAFGGEDKPHFTQREEEALFLQHSDIEYTITAGDQFFGKGSKTSGWASLCGQKGSMAVAVRDIWKEYPKGISLRNNELDIQVWPRASNRNLSFTTPFKEEAIRFNGTRDEEVVKRLLKENPTAPLNLKSFNVQNEEDLKWVEAMIEKYAPERAASYNDTGTSDGTGAAKTTEFVLRFSADNISDQEAGALGISVQYPVIAPADPAYTCATGVLGPFYHKGGLKFTGIDQGLDDIFELLAIEPIKRCRLYGMMRYGNMICSHSAGPGVAYRYYYDKDPSKALRYVGPYNNEANDQIYSVWCNFVRTGELKHFLLASAYSQNVADVSICHAHPINPWAVGLMHYHNAHQWSGDHSPSHTLIAGLLLHYYFTGNRRLLEVSLEVADWAVRWQEACGIISNRYGPNSREFTGPLWCVIEAYKATWETKYGDLARRSLTWFLNTQSQPGTFPSSVYTRGERGDEAWVEPSEEPAMHAAAGGIYQIFRDGLRLFPSNLLRKTIIAEADYIIYHLPVHNYYTEAMARKWLSDHSKLWPVHGQWYWTQWGPLSRSGPAYLLMFLANVVSLAYEITGDPIYVAYAKYMIEEWFPDTAERVRNFCPCLFTFIGLGAPIPVMAATVVEALKKDPDGVACAEKEWRQKRAELGNPIYDGPYPGIPIDQEHFDANMNVVSMTPIDIGLKPLSPKPKAKSMGRLDVEITNSF